MEWARTSVQGRSGERGIRADVQPEPETFSRLASLVDLVRERVATRVELVGISDSMDWSEYPEETRIGGVSLPSEPPRPRDVVRLAGMLAADIITMIDSSEDSAFDPYSPIGLQVRLSVNSKGIECTYRLTALERID